MRRFLSFMLGLVFGIVFLLGAFGLAIYSSIAVVHPNEIYTDIEQYLGKLGDISLLQAYYDIMALYQEQTGTVTSDKLYSVGDFLKDNEISHEQDGKTMAFGIEMPSELLEAPLFEYFNNTVDENGHTGVQRALKKIKVGAIPAIVNMFATPTEDGSTAVDQEVVDKLNEHSMFDLVYGENANEEQPSEGGTKIVANLSIVLEGIKLDQLLPIFDNSESDNFVKNILQAVGQADIGKLITGLTGDGNILTMLNQGGALEDLGALKITDILGDSDQLISSLLGNLTFADFVAENGDLAIVDALGGVSIAGLFGLVKRQIKLTLDDTTDVQTYSQTNGDVEKFVCAVATQVVDDKTHYYISTDYSTANVTTWYEGKFVCADGAHTHDHNCYEYVWYMPCKSEDETHTHEGEIHFDVDSTPTPYVVAGAVYSTIANFELTKLFDENGAFSLDNIVKEFDNLTIDTLLNDLLADNELLDNISKLLQLDNMTLEQLLADGGFDQLIDKVFDVPLFELLNAFGLTEGLDAIKDILGDMSLTDLTENGGLDNIELASVLGLIKRDFMNEPVMALKLSTLFNEGKYDYNRFESTLEDGSTKYLCSVFTFTDTDQTYYAISPNAETYQENDEDIILYEATLDCANETHTNTTHARDCYSYVFYQQCANEDANHVHADVDVNIPTIDDDGSEIPRYCTKSSGLFAILGNITVGGIMNGGLESLMNKLTGMKLGELFEALGMGKLEGALASLADLTIAELTSGGYESITLGALLGYTKNQLPLNLQNEDNAFEIFVDGTFALGVVEKQDGTILLTDDETDQIYYEGKLNCQDKENHTATHTPDCYEYLWYKACEEGCTAHTEKEHTLIDGQNHILADGIFGALVDLTIGDITNNPDSLMSKVFDIKLGTLLGEEELEGLMATLADYTINDLMKPDTLNNIGLADILGYLRLDVTSDVTDTAQSWTKVFDDNNALLSDGTNYAMSVVDESTTTWYKAHLTCKTLHEHKYPQCGEVGNETCGKTHLAHDVNCYGYVWYEQCKTSSCKHLDCVTIDGKPYSQVSGIYSVLGDLTVGSLTGDTDIMTTLTNRLTLGDIFGTNIPSLLESLKDEPIANIGNAMETVKVGELLGHKLGEDDIWYKLVCSDENHTHGEDDTVVENACYKPLEGIEKVLASKTIDDLKDLSGVVNDLTLTDVFGEGKVPSMLQSIADTKISNLENALNDVYVGEFLGYEKGDKLAICGDELHTHTDDCYRKLICDNADHAHTDSCYLNTYKWLELINKNCHSDETEHVDACYQQVTGITAKLANEKLNTLSDIGTTIQTYTLADVFGGVDKVPSIMKSLANTQICNLNDALQNMYVGEFLEYVQHRATAQTIEDCSVAVVTIDGTVAVKSNNDNTKYVMLVDNVWYDAVVTCATDDCLHNATLDCYGYVWYEQCTSDCGHTNNEHEEIDGLLYSPAVGITAKLANEKISELSNLSNTIQNYSLYDVLGSGVPSMLESIKHQPIKNLSNAIDDIYVGEFLGYTKGGQTGETQLDCKVAEHTNSTHTNDCYYPLYKWLEGDVEVKGLMAKVANKKVGNLGTIADDIQDFKLGDILEPETNPSPLMSILYDRKIGEISTAMDDIYLGTAMGNYRKNYTLLGTETITEFTENVDGNDIVVCRVATVDETIAISEDNTNWYVGELACTQSHNHTKDCYKYLWYTNESCTDDKVVVAPTKAFVNSKLDNVQNTIDNLTLGELVDCSTSPILNSLKDSKVTAIGTDINNVHVGTAMGYYKKLIDVTQTGWMDTSYTDDKGNVVVMKKDESYAKSHHDTWYEASACTNNTTHTCTADCFKFVWYEACELENHDHTNCQLSCLLSHEHVDKCYTCDKVAHNHTPSSIDPTAKDELTGAQLGIDGDTSYYTTVKGLNAKMSNLTVGGMQGNAVLTIMTDLTMGDMVESNILRFNDEERHKLAIIYCGGTDKEAGVSHSITVPTIKLNENGLPVYDTTTGTVVYEDTILECNLWGYLQYASTSKSDTPAQDFFHACHTDTTGVPDEYLDEPYKYYETLWEQDSFSVFVSKLLAAMTVPTEQIA